MITFPTASVFFLLLILYYLWRINVGCLFVFLIHAPMEGRQNQGKEGSKTLM